MIKQSNFYEWGEENKIVSYGWNISRSLFMEVQLHERALPDT